MIPDARRDLQSASYRRNLATQAAGFGDYRLRSRMSFATCPVALTLYSASSIFPAGDMTKVDRITPATTLPYNFFSPQAPYFSITA